MRHFRHQEKSQGRECETQDQDSLSLIATMDIEMDISASHLMIESHLDPGQMFPTPPATPSIACDEPTTTTQPKDDDATVARIKKDLLLAKMDSQEKAKASSLGGNPLLHEDEFDPKHSPEMKQKIINAREGAKASSPKGELLLHQMNANDPNHAPELKKKIRKARKSWDYRDSVAKKEKTMFGWFQELLDVIRNLKNKHDATLKELHDLKQEHNAILIPKELHELKAIYQKPEIQLQNPDDNIDYVELEFTDEEGYFERLIDMMDE